ncbi:hypothetical protein PR202_gb06139 [Eleusine coracana subsp. coracana]|uniref:Transmembrane protein 53 n=1 Tax=Eleusine coracana subsp. coracana TaxID=191504 RepID=A0AAV5E8W9_ELECO|nr:hypothetical protein PR202_gb06139 [Eleusine coracana subsp. coracana]
MAASAVRLFLVAAAAAGHRRAGFRCVPVTSSLSFPRNPPSFRGRANLSCSSLSLPSAGSFPPNAAPFNILPPDSEPFIEWNPPPPDAAASPLGGGGAAGDGATLVVLLGWLGARQKHLRRYADLYRERGVGAVRFVVPVRELLGFDLGRRVERRVADLAAEIAAWCDADRRRTLLFHTFSNTGWLAYGAVLENLQSRADITERIRGCIVDSAPVLEIRPEVWAAGFSVAMLKKSSSMVAPSVDSIDEPVVNGTLNRATLQGSLNASEKQPSCPQFYLYSSADKVIPAECVESFINLQKTLGRSVFAHNFVSSPHVDHYRSFPHVYSAKIDEFLKICSTARVSSPVN